jgi:myo-inositol-1(or 4)-monophosphatase
VATLATWSISVGLIEADQPTLGCVYLPVSDEMFVAGSSGPLYWNGEPLRRDAEPGMLTGTPDPEVWIAVPSNYHKRYQTSYRGKLRSLGSTAAHLAWTARGAVAGSFAFARLWDAAGGLACCRAAGVAFSYLSGRPVDFNGLLEGELTPEPLVAAHPADIGVMREAFSLIK